ncbi:MAG: AmmeMemoRadiSam system protein B [Phycisphaerae bacterium]|nr:AmmeMemoRadiSam system protein B [Phycisphaerae bacterium]NIP54000.1 AmmeMemoRadiSam system protein B [Phycisphaerae bacterium]NIS51309.1 AmmeMemoRadiSam system protein B [Phycisphaerae bacterium]NIU10402.1 AmmeMemoRadiSam system protein B [Phycisphaerae bacterium]NIU58100.1 AmmeMemoRadiSam system protein B [Phycisphaerae bacterium]
MEREPDQKILIKAAIGLGIVLTGALAILLWKTGVLSISPEGAPRTAEAKETTEPTKKEPASLPKVVHRSIISERGWYTSDSEALRKEIAGYYEKAKVDPISNVIAMILPHAGYRYSGQIAVRALKTTDKKYSRIIVIGPSHRAYMEEMLSVSRATHYETPLGEVPLDVDFINKLLEYPVFRSTPYAHTEEHSVQIELPLLQHNCKDFKFVPIVAGHCSTETIRKAGSILKSLVNDQTLVIASSDFVHYGQNFRYVPFRDNVAEQIKKVDMGAYEHIANLDCEGFVKYKQATGATICGSVPVAILLSMLEKPVKAHLIEYATSGEMTGDYKHSVSYLSAAFSGAWPKSPATTLKPDNSELSEKDKEQLLTLARKTIINYLQNKQVPQPIEFGITISEAMKVPRAAFVSLKKTAFLKKIAEEKPQKVSQLRGCIGDIFSRRPLYKSVIGNAINAAVNDRRFRPVTITEFADIKIEISALTAPKPISSPDEIRIGVDGVVLKKDGRSAVFLPQVAPEQGWNLDQTLTNLSLKAGLAGDAWKEGASFLVFQAVVFGEEK